MGERREFFLFFRRSASLEDKNLPNLLGFLTICLLTTKSTTKNAHTKRKKTCHPPKIGQCPPSCWGFSLYWVPKIGDWCLHGPTSPTSRFSSQLQVLEVHGKHFTSTKLKQGITSLGSGGKKYIYIYGCFRK